VSESALAHLRLQLYYQLPMLLVAVVALVLAVALWRRAPQACLCVALGGAILLFTGVIFPVVQATLLESIEAGRERGDAVKLMNQMGLVATWVRAGGVAIIVAAAFVGRAPVRRADGPRE
jgi:hypothetical protein